jgi:hypothetical protein
VQRTPPPGVREVVEARVVEVDGVVERQLDLVVAVVLPGSLSAGALV